MGDRLLDMLKESVLISGVLALGVVGACIYLAVTSQEIPETMAGMALTVLAFFFGSKTGRQTERMSALLRAQKQRERDFNERLQSSRQPRDVYDDANGHGT